MGKSKGKNSKVASRNPNSAPESSAPAPPCPTPAPVEGSSSGADKETEAVAVKKLPESIQPPSQSQECPICKSLAISRCGGCNEVAYCSREHQKLHWKTHKSQCVLWKICESAELGRYLTATRDIKPGEVVIREGPLLITPPRITTPVCLGCYHEFLPPGEETNEPGDEDIKPESCPEGCGWPMCNRDSCKQNRADHRAECKAAVDRGGLSVRNFGQDHPLYQSIGVLRGVSLKETRPEAFQKLLTLQAQSKQLDLKAQKENDEESDDIISPQPDISMAITLLLNFFQLAKKDINEELIRKISGIIETNGHEIPIPGNLGQVNRRLIGVYHICSFMEHNCHPNCTKSWDSKTKEIVLRTSVAVKKGDHLSISYVDPLWGTNDRQNFLQLTKYFTCACDRCKDGTELGCHISSIRCRQISCSNKVEVEEKSGLALSSTGMIVPEDPLDAESQWKCTTCGEIYPVKYATSIIDKIGREMEDFTDKRGDIVAEEEFIRKFSKVLAPHHFYLLEIKVELAQLYGRTPDEPLPILSPQKLLRKTALCEELLHVLNVIVPGYHRLRALILYELQASVGQTSKIKYSFGKISTPVHVAELIKCQLMLREVIKVLSWEPEMSVEYRRCEGAKKELVDVESLIEALTDMQNDVNFLPPNVSQTQSSVQVPSGNLSELNLTSQEDEDELELF